MINSRKQRLIIRLQLLSSRLMKMGVLGIAKRIIKKSLLLLLSIVFFPLSIILYVAGFRRLCLFTDRIGHLAIEPDTLIKAQTLGLIKPRRWFVLAPSNRVSNQHLLKYWETFFSVYRSPLSCFFLHSLSLWPFMRYDVSHFINNDNAAQLAYRVNNLWTDKKPVLTLSAEDKIWGDAQFKQLGLPKDAWFVCIHAREGGFSPIDESLHFHRNGRIENLLPAIEEIIRRGGWVVRLGDATMIPLNQMSQVIDYAHHPLKSERLDVILCARARFILGNTSGIFLVGTAFGVPSALANMIPMPTLGFHPGDLSMPKLYRKENTANHLSFAEVMQSNISTFRYAALYEQNKIIVEENTAQAILALTIEMLDRLAGKFMESEEDKKLHERYMSYFEPRHYSYGAASKISFTFLRQYLHLV